MGLLVAYLVILAIGQSITIGVGLAIDRMYSPAVSLPVSIVLYFVMFWIAWKIAIWVTEPRAASAR